MNDLMNLTEFEKYLIDKGNYEFNYSFETLLFVIDANESVIRYYYDRINDYLLRDRFEKKFKKKLTDLEYYNMIEGKYHGFIFPINKSIYFDESYVLNTMNSLLDFVNKINYNDSKYSNIINIAKKAQIDRIISYKECIKSARDLKELEEHNINEYINKIQNEIKYPYFSFLYQLHDFLLRLQNYYLSIDNLDNANRIKEFKKELKSIN